LDISQRRVAEFPPRAVSFNRDLKSMCFSPSLKVSRSFSVCSPTQMPTGVFSTFCPLAGRTSEGSLKQSFFCAHFFFKSCRPRPPLFAVVSSPPHQGQVISYWSPCDPFFCLALLFVGLCPGEGDFLAKPFVPRQGVFLFPLPLDRLPQPFVGANVSVTLLRLFGLPRKFF